MKVTVDRLALIRAIEQDKRRRMKAYEAAVKKVKQEVPRWRVRVIRQLEGALRKVRGSHDTKVVERAISNDYRVGPLRFADAPEPPGKPNFAGHDEALMLLRLNRDKTLTLNTSDKWLQVLRSGGY